MEQNSESLLTQILYLVQQLHNDVTAFNQRLSQCEQLTSELQLKIQGVIDSAFPDGDVDAHKQWHARREMGSLRRFLLKLLT